MTEEEMLIRQAVTEEANQAVDAHTVARALQDGRKPRRRRTGMLVAVAGFAVAAAVVAVVVPLTASRQASPVAPASAPNQPVPATQENILLVGLDNGFADNGQSNADTIVLVRHNADGSFHALSLPRDSYVDIPGFGMHKLNSAYARGAAGKNAEEGRKLLVKTVQNLTGVKVDHYAFVNQADFGKVANAVGGVEVCLKNAVKDQFSNADFPAGKQVLTGDAALAFLRQRHGLPNGDLDRIARGQAFLRALIEEVAASGNASTLVNAVKDVVAVDPGWNVVEFANQVARGATTASGTIPYSDTAKHTPSDGDAIAVDVPKVQDFTAKFLADGPGNGSGSQEPTCVW
ncbi:hypothetical protein GCM10029964_075110 [Kibdelosporangium lantanae]